MAEIGKILEEKKEGEATQGMSRIDAAKRELGEDTESGLKVKAKSKAELLKEELDDLGK